MRTKEKYSMMSDAMYVLTHYGIEHQKVKTVEEICELGTELLRDIINDRSTNNNSILEEIADVEVMLLQLRMIYEDACEQTVEEIMRGKLARQVARIIDAEIDIDVADLVPLGEECTEPAASSRVAE